MLTHNPCHSRRRREQLDCSSLKTYGGSLGFYQHCPASGHFVSTALWKWVRGLPDLGATSSVRAGLRILVQPTIWVVRFEQEK